jgi:transketolase
MSDAKPMRLVFGETLCELGDEFPNLVALDADVSSSTQTKLFGAKYPDRFFNVGIAEANMVSIAAGMATAGLIPVASTFAFLLATRAADPVRSLIGYGELNVKLAGGYAGLSDFADGASHQAIADMAVMQAIPNITVLVPSDITTTKKAVRAMLEYKGAVYLRLSREAVTKDYADDLPFEIGKGTVVNDGADVTLIGAGVPMRFAREAVEQLKAKGISARLIDMHSVKPLDKELVEKAARETGAIVTIEEHNVYGGLGSSVCGAICETVPVPVLRCGVPDRFGESGKYEEILERAGLSTAHIVALAEQAVAMKG